MPQEIESDPPLDTENDAPEIEEEEKEEEDNDDDDDDDEEEEE